MSITFRHQQHRIMMFAAVAMIAGVPIAGSFVSMLIVAAMLAGLVQLRGFTTICPRPVALCAPAFVSFFLAEALSAAINWNGTASLREIGENFAFLGLIPLVALFWRQRQAVLPALARSAPWAAFAALAFALVQQFGLAMRPQGGAGNAYIFAMACALLLGVNWIAFAKKEGGGQRLAIAGLLASSMALLLSGSRAMWPLIVVLPAVLWWTGARQGVSLRRTITPQGMIVLTLAVLLGGIAVWKPVSARLDDAVHEISALQTGEATTGLGKRMVVWRVAMEAIAEKPFFGHGPDSPRRLMEERSLAVSGAYVTFSHFHNVVLNEMVRAGIPGVMALASMLLVPLLAMRYRRRDDAGDAGFALLVSLQVVWLTGGTINLMFDHDILDLQFTAVTAIALVLAFGPDEMQADGIGNA